MRWQPLWDLLRGCVVNVVSKRCLSRAFPVSLRAPHAQSHPQSHSSLHPCGLRESDPDPASRRAVVPPPYLPPPWSLPRQPGSQPVYQPLKCPCWVGPALYLHSASPRGLDCLYWDPQSPRVIVGSLGYFRDNTTTPPLPYRAIDTWQLSAEDGARVQTRLWSQRPE